MSEQKDNATIIKVDRPSWKPPQNQMLQTFFESYKTIENSIANKPEMRSDQIEKLVKSLLGMVAKENVRKSIEKKFASDVEDIKKEKLQFKPELNRDDMDHVYSLAYLRMLGRIWDQKNKYYHIEGNELKIAIMGEDGYDANWNPIKLMSVEKAEELSNSNSEINAEETGVEVDVSG